MRLASHRPGGGERLDVLAHVVRADDRGAPFVGGDGDAEARGERAGLRVRVAEDLPQRALAREADDDRAAQRGQLVEPPDELEVVLDGLAEADARIQAHERLVDPGGDRYPQALLEERLDVFDDVVVAGVDLHRARLALHVHEAEVGAGVGDYAGQLRVGAQRGHVVDELGPERDRAAGDLGLGGVDRDRHLAAERLQHRDDAAQLVVERNPVSPGRVDSPPMSTIAAPCATACARPPSQRRDRSARRRPRTSPA